MPFRARRSHRTRSDQVELGVMLSVAVVVGYLEAVLMPPLPVPGVRLGLANLVVLLVLARHGALSALAVSLGRVLLVGSATGTLAGPIGGMACAGALASVAAMALVRAAGPRFSVVGWSVAGSAAHVLAQLSVAAIVVSSGSVLALAPFSLALSLPAGLAIGLCARSVISRVSRSAVSFVGA